MTPPGVPRMLMSVIFLIMVIFIALAIHWAQVGETFKAWIDMALAIVCLGLIVIVKEYG